MSLLFIASSSAALSYGEWIYHKRIYLNTTESGAYTAQRHTGFPLYVMLDSTNFDFSQAKLSGGDVRFSDWTGRLIGER
jgi:hypothetical protein